MSDKSLHEWLGSIRSEKYREDCLRDFSLFQEFLKQNYNLELNGDQILEEYDRTQKEFFFDKAISGFAKFLEDKGKSGNSAITASGHVRGFFSYHRRNLRIRRGELKRKEMAKRWHTFKNAEIKQMLRLATVDERALILTLATTGLRISDVLDLKRKSIEIGFNNRENDSFFILDVGTQKEGILGTPFLSLEAYQCLQDFWGTIDYSEFVFPSPEDASRPFSEVWANRLLTRAWTRAFPQSEEAVRVHELRAFVITTLSESGINDSVIRRLVGKKIDDSMKPYLSNMNVSQSVEKVIDKFQFLNGNGSTKTKIEKLEQEIADLRSYIDDLVKTLNENGIIPKK